MDESTPFEVKYQGKTAILTVSNESIRCNVGNIQVFSIEINLIRSIEIPKKEKLLINYQKNEIESIIMYSKHVSKIKDSIILAHNQAII